MRGVLGAQATLGIKELLFVIIIEMTNFWENLPKPFFALAPMEAVTDVVFRQVIAKAGAPDVWFSEFTNATGWVHAGQKAIGGRLIKTDDEHPIIAQIWGGEPGDMEQLANRCRELGFDGIDINMGCPAKSAIKSGGSALIRKPDIAIEAIKSAQTAGLPVSVKTRLGYTHVDEWHVWLKTLLEQDIVNLTIHLRTKKEMSKVPAHFELIPEIIKLRDEIAPQTLLTINGDIQNRQHGIELSHKYPGIDGIMIGRGVLQDPFCFNQACVISNPEESAFTAEASQERQLNQLATSRSEGLDDEMSGSGSKQMVVSSKGRELINLLFYHLDLYDQWQPELSRPYETLKRFFKIYIRDFDGARELRDELMQTKSTTEARQILNKI